jgi:hypothetical protein
MTKPGDKIINSLKATPTGKGQAAIFSMPDETPSSAPGRKLALFLIGLIFLFQSEFVRGQVAVGQWVPDVTETNCQGVSERIYDVLGEGKPILVFKTDMICSNTTAWGTTIRQFANLHAATYRTWVCADFEEANSSDEQCGYMQQYEQQTGLGTAQAFRFIDEVSAGPYDPNARKGLDQILCYQGYIVIGLDSTIAYVGNSLMGAVNAALAAAQVAHTKVKQTHTIIRLFPNPVHHVVEIETDEPVQYIEILDSQGRKAITANIDDNRRVDVSALASGLYTSLVHTFSGQILKQSFVKY